MPSSAVPPLAGPMYQQDRSSVSTTGAGSPNRRTVNMTSQTSMGSEGTTGSGRGCGPTPGGVGGGDGVRKSRSQGGKKLQKCLSTASYGEESSLSRPPMTPLSHNLLMTRQYCSFGSSQKLILITFRFFFVRSPFSLSACVIVSIIDRFFVEFISFTRINLSLC